jgi:hypothetical protein
MISWFPWFVIIFGDGLVCLIKMRTALSGEMSTDISTIFGLGFIDKFTYAYSLHVQAILC